METSESVLVSKLLFILPSSKSAWSPVMAWCRRKWSQVNWKGANVSMFRFWYVAATLFTLLALLPSSTQFLGLALIFGPQHLTSFWPPIKQLTSVVASFPFARWDVHILTAMYSLPGFEDFLKLDPFDFFGGSKGSNEIRWLIICSESTYWNLVNFLLSCWSWRWQCFLGAPKEIILKFKSKICGTFPNLCF